MPTLTHDQLHALALRLVKEAGGQVAASERIGISQSAVSQALSAGAGARRFEGTLIRIVEALHAPVEVRYLVDDSNPVDSA